VFSRSQLYHSWLGLWFHQVHWLSIYCACASFFRASTAFCHICSVNGQIWMWLVVCGRPWRLRRLVARVVGWGCCTGWLRLDVVIVGSWTAGVRDRVNVHVIVVVLLAVVSGGCLSQVLVIISTQSCSSWPVKGHVGRLQCRHRRPVMSNGLRLTWLSAAWYISASSPTNTVIHNCTHNNLQTAYTLNYTVSQKTSPTF